MHIDEEGWCSAARRVDSPNCNVRPLGSIPELLVIHNISLPPGEFGGHWIEDLFCNQLDYDAHPYFEQLRPLRVSAHFLVTREGGVVQFVSANDRAWHAGASSFQGREQCNDFSIGIELEGTDDTPFSEGQYQTLAMLSVALWRRYQILNVTGHEHIAPGRKTDPGPCFDWNYYSKLAIAQHAPLRICLDPSKSQGR